MNTIKKLFALFVLIILANYSYGENLTISVGDAPIDENTHTYYAFFDGDKSIAEGTFVQFNLYSWHTQTLTIYMNGEPVWTGQGNQYVSDIYHFTAGKNCKILGGNSYYFDWDFRPNIYITQDVEDPATLFDLTLADGSDAHGTVAFTVDGAAATQAKKDDVVTVSVTPAEGYSTKDVTVRAYTTWAGAPARAKSRAAAPELKDNIDVTAGENGTWTFTMPEANVWVVVTYTKNLQDAWIEAIADQTYTGEAIEPTVTVKDGETTLTEGTDYTVSYSHNTDTGTATVTITAVEGSDYSGTATATFKIRADKTALSEAITEAEAWYESIKDYNPTFADNMLYLINGAKEYMDNPDISQESVDTMTDMLLLTIAAAQADLAKKRVTITIPAKSYVARIDADKRQIETAVSGVSLYTVKNVTNTEVELTAELNVVKAEMPYLIYNDNDEEVTVSIVVSSEEADDVQYDSDHFKGTLVDKTFTDEDMQAADHYVLSNGHDFVWVKDAGTLAAGKCWIEQVPASEAHARALSIVFEGGLTPTGINAVSSSADKMDGEWYDLSGRRVAQPAKGIYVKNGKKVIVK